MIFLNKHKRSFSFLTIVFFIFVNLSFVFNTAGAVSNLGGLDETAVGTGHTSISFFNAERLPETIGKIISIALSFIGVIFLALLIYGGYTWMIARGNEQAVEKAKSIIINAIIGLVIVVAAYAITAFVGNALSPTP